MQCLLTVYEAMESSLSTTEQRHQTREEPGTSGTACQGHGGRQDGGSSNANTELTNMMQQLLSETVTKHQKRWTSMSADPFPQLHYSQEYKTGVGGTV